MTKKLFVTGKNGKGAKPSDWRGTVLIVLPIVAVFGFMALYKTTGHDIYRYLGLIVGLLSLLLVNYMLKVSGQFGKNKASYINILPKTKLGLICMILSATLLLMSQLVSNAINNSGLDRHQSLFDSKSLTYLLLLWLLIGFLAIISGIIAIWKQKERSGFVIVPTFCGLLLMSIFTIALLTD